MADPRQALARLQAAAGNGAVAQVCLTYDVDLLVVFGSVMRPDRAPNDLDLAVRFRTVQPDVLSFLDDISGLAGTSRVDLMNIEAAHPVARERALVGGAPLYEASAGAFTRAQMAAMTERMDTEWLRQIDLELMAR